MATYQIPHAFTKTLTVDDLFAIMDNNDCLTLELEARLYRIMDLQKQPTGMLKVWLDRREVEKLCKELKREKLCKELKRENRRKNRSKNA
jgi:hypothetical protein